MLIELEEDLDLLDDVIGFCPICNSEYNWYGEEDYNYDFVKVIMPCENCIYDKQLNNIDKILIDKFSNIISVEQVNTVLEGYFDDYSEVLP